MRAKLLTYKKTGVTEIDMHVNNSIKRQGKSAKSPLNAINTDD